jgi:ATP-dependent Lon protease
MRKIQYVLEKIKAVKGNVKAKKDRIKFYTENSDRIEKTNWDTILDYNFEDEVTRLTRTTKISDKICNGEYSERYVKKLLGI